jgi:hypothetical protein
MVVQRRFTKKTSDEALRHLAAVTLNLPVGGAVEFNISEELSIPDDPVLAMQELMKAPARFAFWSAQAARAIAAAKVADKKLSCEEGVFYEGYRAKLREALGNTFTDQTVQMRVEADQQILDIRCQVVEAWEHADLLRAIRDAHGHRIFALRELIASARRGSLES